MENMKLKDVVELVKEVLSENKFQCMMVNGRPRFMLSLDEIEKFFGSSPPLELDELEHLNESFWSFDITPGTEMVVVNVIAMKLIVQCKTVEERETTIGLMRILIDDVMEKWLRRMNKRKDDFSVIGVYNKFELIQKCGFMYDSEDEANKDANDPKATCPLLIGQLDSGWINLKSSEKDGKIVIEKRKPETEMTPFSLLSMVFSALEIIAKRLQFKDIRSDAKRSANALKISSALLVSVVSNYGDSYASIDCSPLEFYAYIENELNNTENYPQAVFDFKSLHEQFLPMFRNACEIVENLDETQTWLARRLYQDTLENLEVLSNVECTILREQHERDPETGKFKHPKFWIGHLLYTIALGTLLNLLELKFDDVMRMHCLGDTGQHLATYESHKLFINFVTRKNDVYRTLH